MPEITKHAHGTMCWTDLATTDPASAKAFYQSLFGWTLKDDPMGDGQFYTRFLNDGRDVGAASAQRKEDVQMGIPPHWNTYIAVDDVDAVTPKATSLGGKILMPPFDVFDAGRMSVVQDPTGAVLCLWQAKKHIGARVKNEPNSPTWAEVMTTNVDTAGKFYTGLLGWKAHPDHGGYTLFKAGSDNAAGMMAIPAAEAGKIPPHWMVYFAVADCDATTAKAMSLGGKTYHPPTDVPGVGRFAVLGDAQGAAFGVIKLAAR
jgi:uncharacterized protein